jgi:CheY-like chemotaxis protein
MVKRHRSNGQTRAKKLKTVMLIDDNEIDNFINTKVLESCGADNILTFRSPTTALQHLTQTQEIPQLIFLDLRFPMMDGFDFLDKFAQLKLAQQPDIFILTCSVNPADIQMAQQKTSGYIDKPLTTEKLFQLLDTTKN